MKVKQQILLAICLFLTPSIQAQELTIKEIQATNDLSASQYKRNDINEHPCALIKVQLATSGATFEGNVIQPVEYKAGEYWVYMPGGNKELMIKHPSFLPLHINFADYGIKSVQSLVTYRLTLLMPQTSEVVQTQKLTINYTPASALVLIDSKTYQGNGHLELRLPIGTHDYQIVAVGYDTVEGSVKLNASSPRTITENLTIIQQQSTNESGQSNPIANETDTKPAKDINIESKTKDDSPNKVLENFVSKMCGIYNVELSKTKMSEIEALYDVKQKKDDKHYEICIKDNTEFKDILDNGTCNLVCIHPQETKKLFPSIDSMSWESSYKEWNEWFTSHGFEEKPYDPYYQKQASLTYVNGGLNVILMFNGKEKSKGTWFSLIMCYEP